MNASEQIDQLIAGIDDWRGKTLADIRQSFLTADPEIIEEWKWMGSPVWCRYGNLAVANPHKDKVKVTFSHGASLPDPKGLFNAGLDGKVWRAIDLFEGNKLDTSALHALIRAAVEFNRLKSEKKAAGSRAKTPRTTTT